MRLKPILFFVVVGGLAAFLVLKEARNGSGGVINIGQMAPDFTVKDSTGKEVNLSDFRGKFVLLNFWATWCGPCAKEMPDLELMTNAFKERKFQMMAISVDVSEGDVEKFYKDRKLTLPWYADPGRKVASKYSVGKFPETFLIDRNGHVVKHYPGPVNAQIISQVEGYLREQETAEQASSTQ